MGSACSHCGSELASVVDMKNIFACGSVQATGLPTEQSDTCRVVTLEQMIYDLLAFEHLICPMCGEKWEAGHVFDAEGQCECCMKPMFKWRERVG